MRVMFYVYDTESDIYDLPNDITESELDSEAIKWMEDNVVVGYDILDDDE